MDSSLISRTARMSGSSSTTSARAALTAGSSWLGAHDGARHLGGPPLPGPAPGAPATTGRSGERPGGEEGRSRGAPDPLKKKKTKVRELREARSNIQAHDESFIPILHQRDIKPRCSAVT